MVKFVLAVGGGIAAGIILCKLLDKLKAVQYSERSKVLEDCFGEPVYMNTFTLQEAKNWIQDQRKHLENGAKAIILKANQETLKSIGKQLSVGSGIDNMLIVAIVDEKANDIINSVLIKYEKLDLDLEQILSRGNGMLVVEG